VLGKRHEIQNSDALWEELWKIDPGAVSREIESLYRYHVIDKRIMAFDRHANYWNGDAAQRPSENQPPQTKSHAKRNRSLQRRRKLADSATWANRASHYRMLE